MSNPCPLCDRPLGDVRVQEHHLIPKTFKGRVTIPLHGICHQKIHSTFSERELLNYYHTIDRLSEHSEIRKFVDWVKKKPPEFYTSHRDTNLRRRWR